MNKQTNTPEPATHIFGSTAFNWAVGATREEVLKRLAAAAGAGIIKANKAKYGGLYAWTCVVDAPQSAHYDIKAYRPVGVPTRDAVEFNLTNAKGAHVILERTAAGAAQ